MMNCPKYIKKRIVLLGGVVTIMLGLAGCSKEKLPYDRGLSEFQDEKVNIGYEEAMAGYEGYLDNIMLWEEIYGNQDYDKDGKKDRVLQYFVDIADQGDTGIQKEKLYVICFGNGKYLEIGPFEDNFTGIELYGTDLTGDGKYEIVFCGEHIAATYPQSGSEIAVWTLESDEYKRMSLTREDDEGNKDGYEVGYPISIKKTAKDYEILITCEEINLEEKYLISEEERELFDSFNWDLQNGKGFLTNTMAWKIKVQEGNPDILCLYETFLYKVPGTLQVNLQWDGCEFKVVETKILETF